MVSLFPGNTHVVLAPFFPNDVANSLDFFFSRYHNAGIMVFCVVSTHFLTLFGAGWGWMIVILAVCATYYQTSVRRVRRNARDDLAREVAKKGLTSDVESATWINLFRTSLSLLPSIDSIGPCVPDCPPVEMWLPVQRFWLIYEPVLSQTIASLLLVPLCSRLPAV